MWVAGALGHVTAVHGSVLHPRIPKKQCWSWLLVLYAFLCPSEQCEGGICGLSGVPRSALVVDEKTNSCCLAAVMAKVTSQLGHCSAALRAVPLLHEAETTQSSGSPLLSSLETLQPLDQVFFLQELFPPSLLAYEKCIQLFFRSSDFEWRRRKWILHLAIDVCCISQTAAITVSSPEMHRGIPQGPCLK